MSKKGKKKGAESLEAQARMHETLYGTDYDEATEYRRQALEMVKKHDVKPDEGTIADEELRLFERRLDEFKDGKRRMEGELAFYSVLRQVHQGGTIDPNRTEAKNLHLLKLLGYVKNDKLTGKGRELLRSLQR